MHFRLIHLNDVIHFQMGVIDSLSHLLPDASVALVFLCVLLLSTWLLLGRRNLPPGPWGHPIFGHILDLQNSTDYYLTLLDYRYGIIDVNINYPLTRVILSNNWVPLYYNGLTLIPAWIITCPAGMKLFIHSQTSTVPPLKFGNG